MIMNIDDRNLQQSEELINTLNGMDAFIKDTEQIIAEHKAADQKILSKQSKRRPSTDEVIIE